MTPELRNVPKTSLQRLLDAAARVRRGMANFEEHAVRIARRGFANKRLCRSLLCVCVVCVCLGGFLCVSVLVVMVRRLANRG